MTISFPLRPFAAFLVIAMLGFLLPPAPGTSAEASNALSYEWYDPYDGAVIQDDVVQTLVVPKFHVSEVTVTVEGRSFPLEKIGEISEEPIYWYSGDISLAGLERGSKKLTLKMIAVSGEVVQQDRYVIYDNRPWVEFEIKALMVDENSGVASIRVVRRKSTAGAFTVKYTTLSRSAVAGQDFVPVKGQLAFADGETSKTIRVQLLNDTVSEPLESFGLKLYEPSAGVILGEFPGTTFIIRDSD